MEKPRTKSEACRTLLGIANRVSDRLKRFLVRFAHLDVSEQCEIIILGQAIKMRFQVFHEGLFGRDSLVERLGVSLIGEQLNALGLKDRNFGRKSPVLLVLDRQLTCGNFACLDIWLIKSIDPQD